MKEDYSKEAFQQAKIALDIRRREIKGIESITLLRMLVETRMEIAACFKAKNFDSDYENELSVEYTLINDEITRRLDNSSTNFERIGPIELIENFKDFLIKCEKLPVDHKTQIKKLQLESELLKRMERSIPPYEGFDPSELLEHFKKNVINWFIDKKENTKAYYEDYGIYTIHLARIFKMISPSSKKT